jgi:tetratricopeptide (TPR) repeat protein
MRAAEAEKNRDVATADREYDLAAEAFLKSASEYRGSKSYKKAALNMCAAGDVLSDIGKASQAVDAYQQAADDLLLASNEHLMWGEDPETSKGTAIAMAGCMIYIMIGKEADGFYKARGFAAENASKLRLPAIVRLSQIPQMLESAIQSVNLDALATAENAAVTELKAALASANSQEFSKYVDRGLDMVRELLRGKLKVPKLASQLVLPVDLTFTEEFPVKVQIKNNGDGEATNLSVEWHFDDGLQLVSGERTKVVSTLPPGDSLDIAVVLRSAQALEGMKEFSVIVRGSYSDKLKTAYTLQAGPGTLVLKDYKISEKLLQDADVTDGRVSVLKGTIEATELEVEPLLRIVDSLMASLKQGRSDVEAGELDSATARVQIVNDMVDSIDAIVGDVELIRKVKARKEADKKAYAREKLAPVLTEVIEKLKSQERKLETEVQSSLKEWDEIAAQKQNLKSGVKKIRDIADNLALSGTDVSVLQSEADKVLNHSLLAVGERPTTSDKVEMALVVARSLRNEITQLLESKKAELE